MLRWPTNGSVDEPVSALEAGPNGWVQQVNFVVFGVLTIAFAVGLHRAVAPSRRGIAGPALLALSGVALFLAGTAFPLRENSAGETYDPGGHVVAGTMFFSTSALGLVVLSRRLKQDARWRGLAWYVGVAGAVALVSFVVMGTLVMPDDAPLHEWAGFCQRALILVVVFPRRIAIALRMLRLTRSRPKAPALGSRPRVRHPVARR